MKKFFLLFSVIATFFNAYAQVDHFLIDIEPFDPSVQQMILMMEENPAESFEAEDINGQIQSYSDHIGEFMLLWFWNVEDELCQGQIDGLNLMQQLFSDRIYMVGFAYDNRSVVEAFSQNKIIEFPIIPSSVRIGELLYGSELGQGRLFLIDKEGIIQKAIPRQFFIDNQNSFNQLRTFISELVNGDN